MTLFSREPGGWKYLCALGVYTRCLVVDVGIKRAGNEISRKCNKSMTAVVGHIRYLQQQNPHQRQLLEPACAELPAAFHTSHLPTK